MKSTRRFADIPLMGIRIGLIKNNIWTARFENSRNAVVRAHATLKLYSLQEISVIELADGIMRDCIKRPHGGVDMNILTVYKKWFIEHPLSIPEKSSLALALDNEKLTAPPPRIVMARFKIKQELGLF